MRNQQTVEDYPSVVEILSELEEELPINSEDEWHHLRALLIDFYEHGIRGHARLRHLALSATINRRVTASSHSSSARPSYYAWGSGKMLKNIDRANRPLQFSHSEKADA